MRLILSLVLGLGVLPGAALAGTLDPTWYVFGDSLSDPGNLFAANGGTHPPSPPYFEGRFSNGPVWTEYLPSSLDVVNYAVGGATTGRDNTNDDPGAGAEFDGLLDQVDAFLAGGAADPNGLYVIFAGGNNFLGGVTNPTVQVTQALTDLVTAGLTLQGAGAQDFLYFGLPDLGLTPLLSGDPVLAGGASALTDQFNALLPLTLNGAVGSFDVFDTAGLLRDAVTDPAAFGLTNVIDACLGDPACTDPDQYLFWDSIHPTTAVHEIVAGQVLAFVPEPAALGLLLLAAGALLGARARA